MLHIKNPFANENLLTKGDAHSVLFFVQHLYLVYSCNFKFFLIFQEKLIFWLQSNLRKLSWQNFLEEVHKFAITMKSIVNMPVILKILTSIRINNINFTQGRLFTHCQTKIQIIFLHICRGFIDFRQLPDMLKSIEPPLGLGNRCPKRNVYSVCKTRK